MTTPPWPSPVPELLVLTDRHQLPDGRRLVDQVEAAVAGGARAVVLREKDLPRDERRRLAEDLHAVLHAAGGQLLIASDVDLAVEVGADGVHLAATDPGPTRPAPLAASFVVGRSTHDLDELVAAQGEQAAYATYSPIFATSSKPGHGPALGVEGLQAAAARVLVPVYALGGITADRARACRLTGAAGVAVMGEVMRAADPAAVVADLLAALAPVTTDHEVPTTAAPTATTPADHADHPIGAGS